MQKKLTTWLQSQLNDNSLTIDDFVKPSAGSSNETLIFKVNSNLNGSPSQRNMVLRLANNDVSLFETYDLNLQFEVLKRLSTSDLPTPKLIGNFEYDKNILGREFYVMEMMEGKVINENPLYHSEGWLHDLSESKRADVWLSGISIVGKINSLKWQEFDLGFLLKDTPQDQLLRAKLLELEQYLNWTESLARPYPSIRLGLNWLIKNQPELEPIGFCWGDAKLGNCLFQDTQCVASLDWEGANIGNPVSDLAWWLNLDHALSYGYGIPRLAGLPDKKITIQQWEKTSGFQATNLPYYEMFAAVKFSIIMARSGKIWMDKGWMSKDLAFDTNNGCLLYTSDAADD